MIDIIQHPKFEVTVKALVYNSAGSLLFAMDDKGKWDLPGGRIDEGELLEDGLKREVREELGVGIKSIKPSPKVVDLMDYADNQKRLFVGFEVKLESMDFKPSDENVKNQFFTKQEFENSEFSYQGLKAIKDKLYN